VTAPGPAPNPNDRLEHQIRELWDTVRELARKTLYRAVISAGGLLIQDDGSFEIVTSAGVYTLYAKKGSDGKREFGILRDNGTFVLRTFSTGGVNQAWALHDNANTITNSDDAVSGQGLARPWIPMPFQVAAWTEGFGKTASATFTTVCEARGYKQHPKLVIALRTGAVAGVGGAWRVLVNGVEAATGTIPVGSFAIDYPMVTVPGSHMSLVSIDVQVRVTSGAGSVGAMVRDAYGRES
jgi:hypothetical protein